VGYRAELYKVVYENGVEVSRTLVNTSSYQAAPQYVTVGTKKVEDKKDDTKTTDGDDKTSEDTENKPGKTTNSQAVTGNDQSNTNTQNNTDNQSDTGNDDTTGDVSDFWDPTWDLEEPVE
jgi:hypothetical protein